MTPALETLLRRLGRRRARAPEKPLRDELLSIERLEERAKALAARLTVDPTPRRNARDVFPRFDDNARVLREAYLSMAEDVHRGEFVTSAAEWLLDNYHLVASEIRDVRQNLPRGYYRELPKLATRELAGDARVYALAVELDPPQRQPPRPAAAPPLPQQLPDGRAAHDRRAVGLAEHAQARPHREPAPPGGGGDRRARGPPGGRPVRRADRRRRARAAAAAPAGDPPGVRRAAAAARARVRPAPLGGARRGRRASPRAADDLGGGDPQRAPAAGGGAGLRRERHHEPPPLVDPRLEPVLRVGEPRRGGAAAGPGRRLRSHGLPEPRPLPPGGGGPGRRHRGEPAAGGPADRRERAPGRRERRFRPRGPRRPPPHRQGPRRSRGRRGVPSPRLPSRATLRLRPRHRRLPRGDRAPDRPAARPGLRLRAPAQRLALAAGLGGAPPAAAGQRRGDRRRPEPVGPLRPSAAAAPPRLPGRGAGERADHGRGADAADERRESRGAARAPRGAGPRQPRPARPLRDPQRLHGRPRARDAAGRGDPRRRPRRRRGPQRAPRRGPERPLLPRPPRAAVEPGRGRVDGLGAQARQDRGVEPPPAGSHGHELHGGGRRRRGLPRRSLLHHPRLRHAPAPGRREEADRHRRPPAEPAPLRPASRPRHRGLRDPPAPGERDHGERRRLALRAALRRAHRRRPLHDRGLRHVPGSLRRGDLHRQGALRRRCLRRRPRGARSRERSPLARPLRGAVRAHGSRHRHRGGRRLSGERPRSRAPPAPLGARRLADPVVAVPGRAHPLRPPPQPPAAHLPLEDPGQPEAKPDGARDRGPAAARVDDPPGKPRALDGRGPGRARLQPLPAGAQDPGRPADAAAVARLPSGR